MHTNIIKEENADIIQLNTTHFDSFVLEEVKEHCLSAINHKRSVIINCQMVKIVSPEITEWLHAFHDDCYQVHNQSFVLCEAHTLFPQEEMLNITPTLVEALDIVNMEVIERELLGE